MGNETSQTSDVTDYVTSEVIPEIPEKKLYGDVRFNYSEMLKYDSKSQFYEGHSSKKVELPITDGQLDTKELIKSLKDDIIDEHDPWIECTCAVSDVHLKNVRTDTWDYVDVMDT
jgi:hypothetical protein